MTGIQSFRFLIQDTLVGSVQSYDTGADVANYGFTGSEGASFELSGF